MIVLDSGSRQVGRGVSPKGKVTFWSQPRWAWGGECYGIILDKLLANILDEKKIKHIWVMDKPVGQAWEV